MWGIRFLTAARTASHAGAALSNRAGFLPVATRMTRAELCPPLPILKQITPERDSPLTPLLHSLPGGLMHLMHLGQWSAQS